MLVFLLGLLVCLFILWLKVLSDLNHFPHKFRYFLVHTFAGCKDFQERLFLEGIKF